MYRTVLSRCDPGRSGQGTIYRQAVRYMHRLLFCRSARDFENPIDTERPRC